MYISRVVTESELVARSEKLETSLDSGNHAGQGGIGGLLLQSYGCAECIEKKFFVKLWKINGF